MAEPNHLDFGILMDKVADSVHRVGEVDEPGVRAISFHIADNFEDGVHVSRGMRKTPRSAVFGIGLTDAKR